jgi:DNA-binding NtrC family response regulator
VLGTAADMLAETAELTIPIREASSVSPRSKSPVSPNQTGGTRGSKVEDRGETILLVEDDPHVRELVRDILRRGGFNVLAADSECQALWLWTRNWRQIDLLVTDMLIPHCSSGTELAKKLQNSKAGLPVVYISGFGREIGDEDRAFFQKSPFLQKPLDPSALIEAVTNCLATARKSSLKSAA